MQTHFCSLEARLASTLYAQYAGYIQHWHFIVTSQIWPDSSLTNFGGGARDGGGAGALVVGPGLLVVGPGPHRPPRSLRACLHPSFILLNKILPYFIVLNCYYFTVFYCTI